MINDDDDDDCEMCLFMDYITMYSQTAFLLRRMNSMGTLAIGKLKHTGN